MRWLVLTLVLFGAVVQAALASATARQSGSGLFRPLVEHVRVPAAGGSRSLDLWQDTASGKIVIRRRGEDTVMLIDGHVLFLIEEGVLTERSTYTPIAGLWRRITERYGLGDSQTQALLAHGHLVARPAVMAVPRARWHGASTYTEATHFGVNVGALHRSVSFWVPFSGGELHQLLGMRLADAESLRVRGPDGHDSGQMANVVYSADPAREGTGERELLFETTSLTSSAGQSDAALFRASREHLTGPGFEARFVRGEPLVRHAGSLLVAVPEGWLPTTGQWRSALTAAFR